MKALRVLAALVVAWFVLLFVLGFALAGHTGDRVAARFAESVQGTATIGDASLGLVFGNFSAERLAVKREDAIGRLAIEVGEVHCDLPPLGIALADRTCGPLEIRDVKLDLSSIALFKFQRAKRRPFRADSVIADNLDLTFSPSAFLQSLGAVKIHIDHVEAGPTVFRTPLSFVFALEVLHARVDLPGGITLQLRYAAGKLSAAGSILGSTPVELSLALPKLDSTDDAQSELKKLVVFGKDLAEKLIAQKAEDWLLKKLPSLP